MSPVIHSSLRGVSYRQGGCFGSLKKSILGFLTSSCGKEKEEVKSDDLLWRSTRGTSQHLKLFLSASDEGRARGCARVDADRRRHVMYRAAVMDRIDLWAQAVQLGTVLL